MKNKIANLFSFKKSEPPYQEPEVVPNQRLYCIGDIHGRYDLLQHLHTFISDDTDGYQGDVTIIYMGDYIDRGPASKDVIDCLLSNTFPTFKSVFLMGNHEQVLLEFLNAPNTPRASGWFSFGGLSTLASYGVQIIGIPHSGQLKGIQKEFQRNLPESHLEFYQQLKPFYETEGYYFAHAGVRPKVKLSRQRPEDLLWIREDFLESTVFHGKVVVHGHSVSAEPVVRDNRIGIDTGAYGSDVLTCLVLEGKEQRFYLTANPAEK